MGAFSSDSTLSTPVAINKGGTGQITAQAAIDALTDVSAASTNEVLTKDGSGNATFQSAGGGATITVQLIEYTNGQTTTSSSKVDITGSSCTLANRSGGKVMINQYVSMEANGAGIGLAAGLYYDSNDQASSVQTTHANGAAASMSCNAAIDLDGSAVVGRWRCSSGTATLQNSGNGKSECVYFEVS